MKEFDELQIITSGKISADGLVDYIKLVEAAKLIAREKSSFYRYFVLQREEIQPSANGGPSVVKWILYGTNKIDELLNLIGENDVSFYKVNIINMEVIVVEMNEKEVATEKVFGMDQASKNELIGKLLAESILSAKTQQDITSLDKKGWKPIPKEEMLAYEKQLRNSRRQSSCSGAFWQDVHSLIERLISEENYIYQFYVVTITREPTEGVMGGTTYWEIEGHTNEELSKLENYLSFKKVHLFMVDETGINEVGR